MDDSLVLAASLTYLAATIAFGVYLLRFSPRASRVGISILSLGAALNVTALVVRVLDGQTRLSTYDALLAGCAAVTGGWLLMQLRKPSPLWGAFITPVATMVLYSLHVYNYEAGVVSTEIRYVTPIHKLSSYIGFLIFAVAAVASVTQIAVEYRLKTKQLTLGKASRLPSLRRLEEISHRSLIIGFPIYSVGMALGAIWLASRSTPVTRHFVMATFSWVLYAVTLHARLVTGLQGRRAALLTLAAFVSALFVVLLSALRMGG